MWGRIPVRFCLAPAGGSVGLQSPNARAARGGKRQRERTVLASPARCPACATGRPKGAGWGRGQEGGLPRRRRESRAPPWAPAACPWGTDPHGPLLSTPSSFTCSRLSSGTRKGHWSPSRVIRNQKGKTDSPKAPGGGRADSSFRPARTPPPADVAAVQTQRVNPAGLPGRAGGGVTPPHSCVSPGRSVVAVPGRGPSPCPPAALPSRDWRADALGRQFCTWFFPCPGGWRPAGPGCGLGCSPPHTCLVSAPAAGLRTSSGTDSVGGTMERAVPRANLWSWPRERQEQAPPAGLWAARSPRAGEPRGRGQGGRSGEGKVGMPKWGGGRLAPFNRLQAPGRRHAPGPAAFLGPRPGRCLDGNQRPVGHAS